jgi:hypothetical protein
MPGSRSTPELFADRLAAEKKRLENEVADLPRGPKKEELLRKIRQLDTASRIHEWATSPGLQAPK